MKELLGKIKKVDIPENTFTQSIRRLILLIKWKLYELTIDDKTLQNYKKLISILDEPWKVQGWFDANISYTEDKTPDDAWMDPVRFFERKRGDCEDYSLFANECLKNKFDGTFVCMYTKTKGHCTYLINVGHKKYISIGTFGYMKHSGRLPYIVSDWKGFENWTKVKQLDEDLEIMNNWKSGGILNGKVF